VKILNLLGTPAEEHNIEDGSLGGCRRHELKSPLRGKKKSDRQGKGRSSTKVLGLACPPPIKERGGKLKNERSEKQLIYSKDDERKACN